jgi:hypothetical protein
MNTNRYFYLSVFLALVAVITLTVRQAMATAAIYLADRSYDQIEQIRSGHVQEMIQADRSYDAIETIRLGNTVSDRSYDLVEQVRMERSLDQTLADHSYDAIEQLRALRIFR